MSNKAINQINIPEIESFPTIPTPFKMRNWKQVAIDYDNFVFNWNPIDQDFPVIFRDLTNDTFKIPSYYGDERINKDGGQDSLSSMGSIIGATLAGIDKSNQDGWNYVDEMKKYYWDKYGICGPNVDFGDGAWNTHWYTLFTNVLFYQLADLYPSMNVDSELKSIADKVYDMVITLGGANADFNHQGFDFDKMEPRDNRWKEPDAAAATAVIEYWAYKKFGCQKYLHAAKWSLDFLERIDYNPYYEILLNEAGYIAARMNSEEGTRYDTCKYINWQLSTTSAVRRWGTVNGDNGNWYGYDAYGLGSGPIDYCEQYAFMMNSVYPAARYVPMVRYDHRYARAVGKWVLHIANNTRIFYADEWCETNQSYPQYRNTREKVIAYEGLRKSYEGIKMFASGDPSVFRKQWKLGPNCTDLGIYGGGFVGFLGGIVSSTNDDKILQLDCVKTDFFKSEPAYPTYLYYNPHNEEKQIEINLDAESDLFDSISGMYLERKVSGKVYFSIKADSPVLLVVTPSGGNIKYSGNRTLIDNVTVAFASCT